MFRRKPKVEPLFGSLLDALKAKNYDLFLELGHLPPHRFWRQWKRVYPEDFPQGGLSLASARSIVFPYR